MMLPQAETAKEMVIFSTSKPTQDVMYFLMEQKIPFKVFLGAYTHVDGSKVEREVSFMIDRVNFTTIIQSDLILDQESVLVISGLHVRESDGLVLPKVYLIYNNDPENAILIGALTPVDMPTALKSSGWTYDPNTNHHMIVEPIEPAALPAPTEETNVTNTI